MYTVSACNANQWIADVQPAQTTRWLSQPEALLWVDVEDPTQEDFDYLVREFNFHPLAIEDVQNAHQRPKIDVYEGHVFIVFYAIRYDAATFAAVVREVEVFVGANFVVRSTEKAALDACCDDLLEGLEAAGREVVRDGI